MGLFRLLFWIAIIFAAIWLWRRYVGATRQRQKAEADEMADRRGFPGQARRIALNDSSQGQLQRSGCVTEMEPKTFFGEWDELGR